MTVRDFTVSRAHRMSDSERIDILEEEVRQLRTSLKLDGGTARFTKVRHGPRISWHQAILLLALYDGGTWMPRERLHMALPMPASGFRDDRTLNVQICGLRKALGPDSVLSMYGVGYTLGAPGVEAVRRILETS